MVGEVRGIKGDEFLGFGKGDPFCKVQLGRKTYCTVRETIVRQDAGSSATWNQVLAFTVRDEHEDYNNFSVSLFNENSPPRNDTLLGEFCISQLGSLVARYKNNVPEIWYPILYKGKKKGEISLAFDLIPMPAKDILRASSLIMEVAEPGKNSKCTMRFTWEFVQALMGVTKVAVAGAALI